MPKWKQSALFEFIPEKTDSSGVSVIICPGGSYYWLDMSNEGFEVAQYLNAKGVTAFVLHYRTARRHVHHPVMIQDLQRAMQIVKENAENYGINPEKIGVMGFSAGGHLAGTQAEYFDTDFIGGGKKNFTPVKPYFAAMIYPVVSMANEEIVHKKSRKNLLEKGYSPELAGMMSLEKNVREDMPPIFLLHCTGDKTVDYRNSVAFDKALTEKNVRHRFFLLDEYGHWGHGFGIQPNGKATGWIDEFLKWLKTI
ncbi:MAG: alpha/beta hydrolase [Prevotellaceae bacterium]|nr:alpha/beta hydrolase [Prevotellaceae bacterium]